MVPNTHIPDMLAGPGFISARRCRRVDRDAVSAQAPAYLAIYQLKADDLAASLVARRQRRTQGLTAPTSDALATSPAAVMPIYELLE